MRERMTSRLFRLLWLVCLMTMPAAADAGLSPAEKDISASAREESTVHERNHIVLVWPKNLSVAWYPESKVRSPAQLADWLERCYSLSIEWFGIDPNRQLNAGKDERRRARLMFVHNGMRDYNFGGRLPRPVIGLRNLSGVGSEDWFGWLTHELSHEFLMRFPNVVGKDENNAWQEALCDYFRYWLLKETGMPTAAANWRERLRRSPRLDRYKGGADIILSYHERNGCQSPADLWKSIKDRNFTECFGRAPWRFRRIAAIPRGEMKIEFEGVIDGAGSFTFRGSRVYYDHFKWDRPAQVKINGKPWNNLEEPFNLGFFPNFASAVMATRDGRNTVVLVPHQDRLVLFIDDDAIGAGKYHITISVKVR